MNYFETDRTIIPFDKVIMVDKSYVPGCNDEMVLKIEVHLTTDAAGKVFRDVFKNVQPATDFINQYKEWLNNEPNQRT